jgi:hypothetical protein
MPGEIRPHSLIPSSLQLVIANLQAGALGDAEFIAEMLAAKEIPERLARGHPDHYQAVAVQKPVSALFASLRKRDVPAALSLARAAIAALEEAEKSHKG